MKRRNLSPCRHKVKALNLLTTIYGYLNGTSEKDDFSFSEFNQLRSKADRKHVCHAPFKAMRFDQRGVVHTCCYNIEATLGRYPEMTVAEIWNSAEANKLRKKISEKDFSFGCRLCGSQLKNGEYNTVKLKQYDNLPETQNGYPVFLDFALDNTCNLECSMCSGEFSSSIRKNREKLPEIRMAYDSNFVSQMREFIIHGRDFVFAGGEPFLIDLYYELWDSINALNPGANIHIVTNGTTLNQRIKKLLAAGNYHITHSIDSFTKENYELIRVNAKYEQVMENMHYFKNYCEEKKTSFSVNVCPIKQNRFEIPKIVSYCNKSNIKMYLLNVVYPPSPALISMNENECRKLLEHYKSFEFSKETETEKHNFNQFHDLVQRMQGYYEKKISGKQAAVTTTDSVHFNSFAETLFIKLEQYRTEGGNDEDIDAIVLRVKLLEEKFKGVAIPKERIAEIREISGEKIFGIFKNLTDEELGQMITNNVI